MMPDAAFGIGNILHAADHPETAGRRISQASNLPAIPDRLSLAYLKADELPRLTCHDVLPLDVGRGRTIPADDDVPVDARSPVARRLAVSAVESLNLKDVRFAPLARSSIENVRPQGT